MYLSSLFKKAGITACALALSCGLLVGCSSPKTESTESASTQNASSKATEPRTFTDLAGDSVTVPADASTILTVNSVATQMVLMVGGEDAAATLGQGFDYSEGSLNRKMYPGLADVKTFTRDDATVENVAAINPGLVVIDQKDTVATLRAAGIPTASGAVNSPETIKAAVVMMGEALGGEAEEKAQRYTQAYDEAIAEVTKISATIPADKKPRVLYLRSTTGTTGKNSMPDSWITSAGGINVGAELGFEGSRADISTEAILAAQPDIIICEKAGIADELKSSAAYADLNAVAQGKIYTAPVGTAVWSMGTAEALLQLYWAGSTINPDYYSGIDVEQKTRDFFSDFYGYKLTDDDIKYIFGR